jgi:thiamine biosynthesis lipoprotein
MDDKSDDLLMRVSRRAMACEFEVCFPAGRCENGTDFALQTLDLVGTLDEQLSFFRPESQITTINRLAAQQPVEVESWLFDLLQLATRLCEETQGAYDITSAPLWEAWGFARRAGEIPSDAQLAEARSKVGSHLVELDPTQRTIRFREPGVRINLGSIGKGYALDICAERLLALGMADFLLHGGQSSVLGRGNRTEGSGVGGQGSEVRGQGSDSLNHLSSLIPHPSSLSLAQPWEIGLPNPRRPGQRLGVVRLCDRALGTSGGQFQSFRHRGRRWGHILDPRTGWPAEGVLSTTVVAPSAALADALSTAFYVMSPQASLSYCQTHPEIGMVMVCPSQQGGDVKTHVVGLDERQISVQAG